MPLLNEASRRQIPLIYERLRARKVLKQREQRSVCGILPERVVGQTGSHVIPVEQWQWTHVQGVPSALVRYGGGKGRLSRLFAVSQFRNRTDEWVKVLTDEQV
ncbi:MAG: hypothetical protein WBA12_12625 [Catalinimonas sp.]